MDPALLDFCQGPDRPLEFSLEGPAIVQLLHKVGHREACLVEKLIPDPAALGQTLARQLKPDFIHLIGRHHDPAC